MDGVTLDGGVELVETDYPDEEKKYDETEDKGGKSHLESLDNVEDGVGEKCRPESLEHDLRVKQDSI